MTVLFPIIYTIHDQHASNMTGKQVSSCIHITGGSLPCTQRNCFEVRTMVITISGSIDRPRKMANCHIRLPSDNQRMLEPRPRPQSEAEALNPRSIDKHLRKESHRRGRGGGICAWADFGPQKRQPRVGSG